MLDGRTIRVDRVLPQGERPVRQERTGGTGGAPRSKTFMDSPYRLYVGNLPWRFDDYDLEDAFAEFGEVADAKVRAYISACILWLVGLLFYFNNTFTVFCGNLYGDLPGDDFCERRAQASLSPDLSLEYACGWFPPFLFQDICIWQLPTGGTPALCLAKGIQSST